MPEADRYLELRAPLLHYFGTTDPDLLADVWKEQARTHDTSLDTTARDALAWQAVTFRTRNAHSIAAHLRKEARELLGTDDAPARVFDPNEMADVFLLLVALSNECGVDLAAAAAAKLAINKTRTWGAPDAHGVVEHVKDGAR